MQRAAIDDVEVDEQQENPLTWRKALTSTLTCDEHDEQTDALLALRNAHTDDIRTQRPTPSIPPPTSHSPRPSPSPTVYLAWTLRDAQRAEYVKQARELGLAVGLTRGERVLPLEGTPPHSTPALAPTPSAASPKYTHAPAADSPTKRRYVADPQDVEVVKWIRENEVELRGSNRVLHRTKANRFLQESVFQPSAAAHARSGAQGGGRGEDLVTVDRALSSFHSSFTSAGGSGSGGGGGGGWRDRPPSSRLSPLPSTPPPLPPTTLDVVRIRSQQNGKHFQLQYQ
ncbi:hypothetical protein BV22DRAFT_1195741 [Leucogyrophana mollusca]|uniref:Uncharacterized protein n=1 Tax=Leucogyrophana mollusca TaxID=85980 RepID=A0ACB8BH06_9AGAM|nr:hypothetical protein BV22DRAFT_1195741 [Leucogyrophana mollusca]